MPAPVTLHDTEDHVLHSDHVDADFHLRVGLPVAGFAPSAEPPLVLWVLDGDLWFGTAVELTRIMHQLYGELPPILVVGVAYGTDDPRVQGELRTRDFTPTVDPGWEAAARRVDPHWTPVLPEGRRVGRASDFLRFLVDEARPYIHERFQTAGGNGALFGSSFGGLFAAWSLLAEPGSFDHVIAVSPALWWDRATVLDLEAETAERLEDLPVKLFLAAGSLEEPEDVPFLARYRLVSNARVLAERLERRRYPSLDVRMEVLDGETHTSVVPVGMTRGLRAFLRGTPPPMPASTGGAEL